MPLSLRKLLLVVPVFIAVGIAAARGPYVEPDTRPPSPSGSSTSSQPAQSPPSASERSTPPQTNSPLPPPTQCPMPTPPPAPPPMQPGISAAFSVPDWKLSIMEGKLHLQTVDGARSTCETMTILVNGSEPIKVAISDNVIRLTSGTDAPGCLVFLQASAQKVTRIGPDGATLILQGTAKLVYVRRGKKIDVSSDQISVNLTTGQLVIETEPPRPVPQPSVQPCCTTGSVQPMSRCKPADPFISY